MGVEVSDKESKRRHIQWLKRIRQGISARPEPARDEESSDRRSLEEWQDMVEQRIQEAIQRGEFDNLSVSGKPVDREVNPFADPDWELAHSLMASHGVAPAWIEDRKFIERDIAAAREQLRIAWAWYGRRLEALKAQEEDYATWREVRAVRARWQEHLEAFRAQVIAINKRIDTYNLSVPLVRFQMFRLRLQEELEALGIPEEWRD